MSQPTIKVVALGGGHGLAATLRALSPDRHDITAIVTVADDGGSSGRLREDFDILPPGDLRMALSALCSDDPRGHFISELFQYRFPLDSSLSGHPVGNIVLAGLWALEPDKAHALALARDLLGAHGTVLPMSSMPLSIEASVRSAGGQEFEVHGQANVAVTAGIITELRLRPKNPPACTEALTAIREADWIILGPGSWYTSVMPALLIPELREALESTNARILMIANLVDQPGETEGLSQADHIAAFLQYSGEVKVDTVLVDTTHEQQAESIGREASKLGAKTVLANVQDPQNPETHDPQRLSRVLIDILARVR